MKIRILSGAALIALLAGVLAGGHFYPVILTAFVAVMCSIASFEMLHSAGGIKSKTVLVGAGAFSVLAVFLSAWQNFQIAGYAVDFTTLSVIYALFAVVMCLVNHKDFSLHSIAMAVGFPIILSFAFASLESTVNGNGGIYYLLLLLNFSSICDMGAYFVGSTIGKHKLCEAISPKKTIEGAVGGLVCSLIVTVILVFSFGHADRLIPTLILTLPLCVLGIAGDLFASIIKRTAGIKDYGRLIPGHGGVLDRVDSILMISPVLSLCIGLGLL